LSQQLRCHIESFGRQFNKISDKVQMPETTPTTPAVPEQQQQQGKMCDHDETLRKELSDIRAQLEDTKRKYV